jgi:hypothetical protein
MSEKDKVMLNTCNRKILRKVYGPLTKQGVWRMRIRQKLREVYKTPDLVADIKGRRLE